MEESMISHLGSFSPEGGELSQLGKIMTICGASVIMSDFGIIGGLGLEINYPNYPKPMVSYFPNL